MKQKGIKKGGRKKGGSKRGRRRRKDKRKKLIQVIDDTQFGAEWGRMRRGQEFQTNSQWFFKRLAFCNE